MRFVPQAKEKLLSRLIQLLLSVFSLGFFLSSPLWLPSTFSILEKAGAIVYSPKCLFLICNVIVMVLVRESKLSKSPNHSDIYEEIVNRNRRLQRPLEMEIIDRREEEVEEEESFRGVEGMEGKGLEELNKRVEDFIARVNRQRMLEARLVGCYS
ncbi:hypothetical protein HPP92_028769 [Vanilla planifolia]|uniref:DUF4408 domain-containing protein n=1 Tax=Vanilla planifolia TaxID=51239 RepID=A0A835P9Q3_VANPL|nr:hypothetical protein HPP92_028769 [Vanilla planifolia]